MADGRQKPKLNPPPRVASAGIPDPDAGPGRVRGPTDRGPLTGRAVVVAAMALALLAVFILLPRWQEQRQGPVADGGEVEVAAPSPDIPHPTVPEPVASADRATPAPSPMAMPSPTPHPPAARSPGASRRQPSTTERLFVEVMSEGLAALENRQWQVARSAFDRASRLKPGAPEVADGLARATAGQRQMTIADGIGRARDLENREAWREAERTYSAVLAIDPESAAALVGQRQADGRAALDEKIKFYLANPGRLLTPKVFADATSALEAARETDPSGARLESQIVRLDALLEQASTPVAVVLESDAMTNIVVYRVGRLGAFTRHELNLKPGAYTVIGTRDGYRDVRLRLLVTPGTPPDPLVVRCTELL
jgi:hypothetical protein